MAWWGQRPNPAWGLGTHPGERVYGQNPDGARRGTVGGGEVRKGWAGHGPAGAGACAVRPRFWKSIPVAREPVGLAPGAPPRDDQPGPRNQSRPRGGELLRPSQMRKPGSPVKRPRRRSPFPTHACASPNNGARPLPQDWESGLVSRAVRLNRQGSTCTADYFLFRESKSRALFAQLLPLNLERTNRKRRLELSAEPTPPISWKQRPA